MPNWCTNELTVIGKTELVDKFANDVTGDISVVNFDNVQHDFHVPLSFETLLPSPEKMIHPNPRLMTYDTGNWRVANWGTKWDLDNETTVEESEHDGEKTIQYFFDTAWTPCVAFLDNISPKYPELEFNIKYYEPNMNFQGEHTVKDGQVILDVREDFNPNDWNLENWVEVEVTTES